MSQRRPDYDALRAREREASHVTEPGVYGIDYFYDSESPECSAAKEDK